MKIFFTLRLTVLVSMFCSYANCQIVANYNPKETMSEVELSNYRKFIWDSIPSAISWVNDFEGIFKSDEQNTLESLIEHFEKQTGIEIMLVTIDTNMVAKEKVGEFAGRLLKIWGIGKRFLRNGIVICISKGYKEIKISTDVGIEIVMNEAQKMRIIQKYFIPFYIKNRFYDGTFNGLNALIKQLSPK